MYEDVQPRLRFSRIDSARSSIGNARLRNLPVAARRRKPSSFSVVAVSCVVGTKGLLTDSQRALQEWNERTVKLRPDHPSATQRTVEAQRLVYGDAGGQAPSLADRQRTLKILASSGKLTLFLEEHPKGLSRANAVNECSRTYRLLVHCQCTLDKPPRHQQDCLEPDGPTAMLFRVVAVSV